MRKFLLVCFFVLPGLTAFAAPFTQPDCEKLLTGSFGEKWNAGVREFLTTLSRVPLEVHFSADFGLGGLRSDADGESFSVDDDDEVRFQKALKGHIDFFRAAVDNFDAVKATDQRVVADAKAQYEAERTIALSDLHKAALGISDSKTIAVGELEASLSYRKASGTIYFTFRDRAGKKRGGFDLDPSTLRLGMYNSIPSWQAAGVFDKAKTFSREEAARHREELKPANFLADQGRTLLFRRVGNLWLGYGFAVPPGKIDRTNETWNLAFEVFLVRECPRFAVNKTDILFPQPGSESGALNLCLTPMGLSIAPGYDWLAF